MSAAAYDAWARFMASATRPSRAAVRRQLGGRARHRPERLDVGDGVPGRGVDRLDAAGRELLEGGGAGEQVLAELGRRGGAVAGVAALGAADDEVALEQGGVVLERPEQSADVAAALQPLGDVLDPRGQLVPRALGPRPGGVGLEADLVAQPLQRGTQVLDPGGVLVGGGVEGEPLAQLAGQRVAEPARLRQRDREGPRASALEPFASSAGSRVASSRPQINVASRSRSAASTRPPSQTASSSCWRSATAFQSAIDSVMSPVSSFFRGEASAAASSSSSSSLRYRTQPSSAVR